jgi:hypothetical protein
LTIAALTKEALEKKRAAGFRTGGVPYGYEENIDGSLSPIAREQVVLSWIVEKRLTCSLREIATELTSRKIPTKQGKESWTHTAVASILKRIEVSS